MPAVGKGEKDAGDACVMVDVPAPYDSARGREVDNDGGYVQDSALGWGGR